MVSTFLVNETGWASMKYDLTNGLARPTDSTNSVQSCSKSILSVDLAATGAGAAAGTWAGAAAGTGVVAVETCAASEIRGASAGAGGGVDAATLARGAEAGGDEFPARN